MNSIADVGVRPDVAERQEHAVAVVYGKRERAVVDDADEAGVTALVGALRVAVGVAGREEEHVARLDERLGVVVDPFAHQQLVDPIRDAARVEPVLPETVSSLKVLTPHIVSARPGVRDSVSEARRPG